MKVRVVETVVRELDIDVPDELNSLVDVFQLANEMNTQGKGVEVEGSRKNLGVTVIAINQYDADGKEMCLMVQRQGQIVIPDEGGAKWNETRSAYESKKKAMAEVEKQQAEHDAQRKVLAGESN